ncbi:MAG: efflux transporter outer membrane subunit [Rhodoferax sp.]|nr:efflux transporter outer membrane subunit [Rhodoferax sp.]
MAQTNPGITASGWPPPSKPGAPVPVFVLALATFLVGCAVPGDGNQHLSFEAPIAWSRQPVSLTDQVTDLGYWWRRFSDPVLTDLVETALDANTDILAARAALEQASALRDATAAALSPTLNYSTNAKRSFVGDGTAANNLSAGLEAGWDADLFGVRGHALDSSDANLLAVQAQFGGVQGAVATAVALNYITLRSSQQRLAIAQENLANQLETLQITRWRNQAGLIGSIELEQATVAAGQTRAQLLPLEVGIEKAVHALAVQLGQPPAALLGLLSPVAAVPQAPQILGPSSPGETLRQRPDVRAARYQVHKAIADVQQAQAQRWPVLKLGANIGVGAATLEALSGGGAAIGALVVGLAGPLFDGGAANAHVHAQQAALTRAQAIYHATMLTALREVEDAMVALRSDQEHLMQLQRVAVAAGNAATMARQRYASGLVDFQIVLETQRSLLATQDNQALANANVSTDQVSLYNALGGGWRPAATPMTAATPQSP